MRKPILITATVLSVFAIAFGIYLSQLGTSSVSESRDNPPAASASPAPSDERAPDIEKDPSENNNDQSGKPGEVKG